MGVVNDYNLIELLKRSLGQEVRKILTEELIKEELKAYEAKLREVVESMVNRVSFDNIEGIRDLTRVRDELHIYLHWKDKPVIEKKV